MPPFSLTPMGVSGSVANASYCKDLSCAYFPSGSYYTLPSFNFGASPGLTFSVWFKPMTDSNYARVFDFGNGTNSFNIVISRQQRSDILLLLLVSPAGNEYARIPGAWKLNEWRHLVWTLERVESSTASWWSVYVDGMLAIKVLAKHPVDGTLVSNLVGKSNWVADGPFAGYMDSFYMIPSAIGWNDVRSFYAVSGWGRCWPLSTDVYVCRHYFCPLAPSTICACMHTHTHTHAPPRVCCKTVTACLELSCAHLHCPRLSGCKRLLRRKPLRHNSASAV
jgi:hypothetical protein